MGKEKTDWPFLDQKPELNISAPPLCMTLEQVASVLQVSRAQIYTIIKRYKLPVIHWGRNARVYRPALEAWLAQQSQEASEAAGYVSITPQDEKLSRIKQSPPAPRYKNQKRQPTAKRGGRS